jgi:hypothetical protein
MVMPTIQVSEVLTLLRHPVAIELLIHYHYSMEAEADAIGEPELEACVNYHGERAKILEAYLEELRQS